MAISFRAAGTASLANDPATSVTLAAPAGTAATDVVLACFEFDGGTGITVTPPAGWTLSNRTDSTTTSGTAVYWALGSVASLAFSFTSTTIIGWTLGYIGVNNSTPMDVTAAGQANASSVTGTSPSITTVTANAWIVNVYGFNSIGATFSGETPAGFNRRQQGFTSPTTNDPQSMDSGDWIRAVAGATGTHTTTSLVAGVNQGITIALRPVVSAVPIPTWNMPFLPGFGNGR